MKSLSTFLTAKLARCRAGLAGLALLALLALPLLTAPLGASAQTLGWQEALALDHTSGTGGTSTTRATAVDPATGAVFITGSFTGQVSFGSTTLTSTGANDIFVARYNPGPGTWAWAQQGGGTGDDIGNGIATDGTNVYVTGSFRLTAVIAGQTLATGASPDMFVAAYSVATGSSVWAQRGGGGNVDVGTGVATDGTRVYVTGGFIGTATFAGQTLTSTSTTDSRAFVAAYTTSGGNVWARNAGTNASTAGGSGIATNGTNVYVTGSFSGTATLAGQPLTSAGGNDVFVAAYTAGSGGDVWARRDGGTGPDNGNGITTDGTRLYVTGNFMGTSTFAGQTFTSAGGSDVFVAAYSAAGGGDVWAQRGGNTGTVGGGGVGDAGNGIATDGTNVYVTGSFFGTGMFAGRTLTGAGGYEVFVAAYTAASGGDVGAISAGSAVFSATTDAGQGIAADGGSVYVGGKVILPATFGSITLAGSNPQNGFLARLTLAAPPSLVINTQQTIPAGTYHNITIQSGGRGILLGDINVLGTVLVQAGGVLQTISNGSATCLNVTGPGNFTVAAGGQLSICSPQGISASGATGNIQVTGTRSFSPGAIYFYDGPTAQITGSGLPAQVAALYNFDTGALTLSQPVAISQTLGLLSAANVALNGQALTLLSNATGTALVVNGGTGTVVGTATVQRYIDPSLNPGLGYRHYGTPVQATRVSDLATPGFAPEVNPAYNTAAVPSATTPFPTVFGYDEARLTSANAITQSFDQGFFSPATLADNLNPGRGYTVNIGSAEKVALSGTLNTGTVPVGALSRGTEANAGWQLLGNPYPAPLDWNVARTGLPAGVQDAIYVYKSATQYTGSYQFYQNGFGTLPGGLIGSMQGFFLRVSQNVPAFAFQNAWRSTTYQNPTFNRGTAELRPVVQLDLVSAAGTHEPTYVYFENGATAGFDAHFDADKLPNSTGLNLSSEIAGGQRLAVNGLPVLGAAPLTVPLAVGVPAAGSFSLHAAQLLNLSTTPVYLRDRQTGAVVDLARQPTYSFVVSNASALITGRFELVFSAQGPLATAPAALAAQVLAYPNPAHGSFTVVRPAGPAATATLLNTLGQTVRTLALPTPTTTVDVTGLASGMYSLRLTLDGQTITKRVVLN